MSDILISGLCLDSRRVTPGDLFIAVRGILQDGQDYIPMAVEKGAAAVLTEGKPGAFLGKIPIIEFPDLRNSISHLASRFFAEPSKALNVIGITGTNGKTSCAQWIAQLFSSHHHSCGILGTLGNGFLNQLEPLDCTTPDPITTQQLLNDFRKQGASAVAMEVTSHALTQGRVEGVQFHTAIFTNLTQDHLDYHSDMENYFLAKKRLFTELNPAFSIVNVEDPYGQQLIRSLLNNTHMSTQVLGYSTGLQPEILLDIPVIQATEVVLEESGIRARVQSPWGEGELACSLLGRFNLSNILAAVAALGVQGFPLQETLEAVKSLSTVPGRMMCLGGGDDQPLVVVDYAHTPDALAKVLTAIRAHCRGRLWCVFGCGGDRDRGKRPEMAKVVEALSDEIVITQDNSRSEPAAAIIQDILQGIRDRNQVFVQPDRAEAIEWAVFQAQPNDIVLIAGKGHEEYQIIQAEKRPFSDQKVALQALGRRMKCLD